MPAITQHVPPTSPPVREQSLSSVLAMFIAVAAMLVFLVIVIAIDALEHRARVAERRAESETSPVSGEPDAGAALGR